MSGERRVALVHSAAGYVGPALARLLADRGHDLVLGDASAELVTDLERRGATVENLAGVSDPSREGASDRLVGAGLDRFGRIDAAAAFSGQIIGGDFLTGATLEDLRKLSRGCIEGPFLFLKAVVPQMVEQGSGQVLAITSAAGARVTKGAPLYSAVRAGATQLVKNVAAEVAASGVQVNAIGTNFMDFPEFLAATGANDPVVRAKVEAAVPMKRLGTMEEFAAMCGVFLDGTSGFTTGQFVGYAGGWV